MTISLPGSTSFYLDDGTTAHTATTSYGQVASAARIYDTGSSTVPWIGVAVFNTSAISIGSGRNYLYVVQGSTASDFSSGVQDLATWTPGSAEQDVINLNNQFGGTVYRYLRLKITTSGTSPTVTVLAFVASLATLSTYSLDQLLQIQVLTSGNWTNAVNQFKAWFTGVVGGGPDSNGLYPLTDGNGVTTLVTCPALMAAQANACDPRNYGAIADGTSHPASGFYSTLAAMQAVYPFGLSLAQEMDWLALQKVFNAGGRVQSNGGHFMLFNNAGDPQKPLTLISGLTWAEFYGAKWDASAFTPITTPTWENANPTFAAATGWENATIYGSTGGEGTGIDFCTFNTGAAVGTDVRTGGQSPFYQFGIQVTLPAGNYEVDMTGSMTLGSSYSHGNTNPPYWDVTFFSTSPGEGTNLSGSSISGGVNVGNLIANPTTPQAIGGSYVFNLAAPTTGWLTFTAGGYCNINITQLGVKVHELNCAVWMTRDGAETTYGLSHYPIAMPLVGVELIGPGQTSTYSSGIFFHSYVTTDGTLMTVDKVKITGFGNGIRYGNGAYLIEHNSIEILGCTNGLYFPTGLTNAGENLRFNGGTIGACCVNLNNPGGAEFNMPTTANDYASDAAGNPGSLIVTAGRVALGATHLETKPNTVAGVRIIDVMPGGCVAWAGGGQLLLSAPLAGAIEPPIRLQAASSIVKVDSATNFYNVTDVNGLMCDGAGQIVGSFLNNGNPNLGTMISYAVSMDKLGGDGLFPATANFATDSSDIYFEGGMYPLYGDGSVAVDKWTGQYPAGTYPATTTAIASYSAVRSSDYTINGSNCLKVTKTYGGPGVSSGAELRLLLPADQGKNIFGSMSFLFPNNVGTGTATLYYRWYWVRRYGYDQYGRALISAMSVFKGENDVSFSLAGSMTPIVRGFGTTYQPDSTDPTSNTSMGAPAGATHLALIFDGQNLPAMTYYIFGLVQNNF